MRIVEIEIEKLFGIFDHRIRLNTDDRVTIIHGPNGFGKTVLLELVHGLFNGLYAKLAQIPFQQLSVLLDNGACVVARQETMIAASDGREPQSLARLVSEGLPAKKIRLALRNGRQEEEFVLPSGSARRPPIPLSLPREALFNHLTGYVTSYDDVTIRNLNRESVITAFIEATRGSPPPPVEEPLWWRETKRSVRVEMIQEQRLLMKITTGHRQQQPAVVPAVHAYSKDLAQKVRRKLAESAEVSQSLERTFPARLLNRKHGDGPSENELRARLAVLERKREKLEGAGLLEEEQGVPGPAAESMDDETREVLAIWVEDAEKKLSIFDDLATRIELFQNIINSRFLYKHLRISRRDGFVVTTAAGERLPLTALSSGEQQEMVLLYELLFRTAPNSLVLIDEPELSLHVAWQTKFLDDLIRISELASFDVLIATHSPQIIHTRWDLTVELEGPKAEAELAATTIS
jgi:predicted ATP-binding protein involved in virulence